MVTLTSFACGFVAPTLAVAWLIVLAFLSTEVALYAKSDDVDGGVVPFIDGYFRPGLSVKTDDLTAACTSDPPTAYECGLLKTSDSIKCKAFWIGDDTQNTTDSNFYWPVTFSEARSKVVKNTCEIARERLIGTWVLFGLIFVFRFGFDVFHLLLKRAGDKMVAKGIVLLLYISAFVGLLLPFGLYGYNSIKGHSGEIFGLHNHSTIEVQVADHWNIMFHFLLWPALAFMLIDGYVTFFVERDRYTMIPTFATEYGMDLMNSMMMH